MTVSRVRIPLGFRPRWQKICSSGVEQVFHQFLVVTALFSCKAYDPKWAINFESGARAGGSSPLRPAMSLAASVPFIELDFGHGTHL